MMRRGRFSAILGAILLLVFCEREAKAYTDPGSGALLWQIAVAGFVGLMFYVRRFLNWFRSKIRREQED